MLQLLLLASYFLSRVATANVLGHPTHHVRHASSYSANVSYGCHQACEELSARFGTLFHYPSHDNITFWDARQQVIRPACRVEPVSALNVSTVIDLLVRNDCRFAVKCGGHSRHEDDSNSIGGVTIDLARMNQVTVAANGNVAYVGGGSTSHHVFSSLEPYNLAFIGGRTGSVGVGGFTLGGGTSSFAPRWGWASDNVFEYEIVLANSSIVTVNEQQHPDLYWALRGGANNFGIVTTFVVRVFQQGPLNAAQWTFSANQTAEFLDEAQRLFTDIDDVNMQFEYFDTYSQAQQRFTTVGRARYALPLENPPTYQGLNRLNSEDRTVSINTMSNLTAFSPPSGRDRHLFTTVTYYPSVDVSKKAIEAFREEIDNVKNVSNLAPFLIVYPIPINAVRAMQQRGGNALGIDGDSPLISVKPQEICIIPSNVSPVTMLSLTWSDTKDDTTMNDFSDRVISRIKLASITAGRAHPYLYINYAKFDQDPFSSYGENNKQRLIDIQRSVDPDGIFTSRGLWTGFFKLE